MRRRGRSIRGGVVAAVLAVLAAATLTCAGATRAEETDPWFGRDKRLHFEAAGSLAVAGYAGAAMLTTDRPARAATGVALGLGAGIAKELWDLDGHGDASWRDLTWDAVGTATGVLVAAAFDWTIHRVFNWPVARAHR